MGGGEWGDNRERSLGDSSSTIGMSTTRYDESSMGRAVGTSGEAEDGNG